MFEEKKIISMFDAYLSKLPLARNFPSGENATLYTGSLCLSTRNKYNN